MKEINASPDHTIKKWAALYSGIHAVPVLLDSFLKSACGPHIDIYSIFFGEIFTINKGRIKFFFSARSDCAL